MQYMAVWKIQLVHQRCTTLCINTNPSRNPFLRQVVFEIFEAKPWWHLPSPGLPWQPFFLCLHVIASWTAGEARGGKWSPASLSKVYLLGYLYASRLGSLSVSVTTAFLFFHASAQSQEAPYRRLWESDFKGKKSPGRGSLEVPSSLRAGRCWAMPLHRSQLQPLFLVVPWSRKKEKMPGAGSRI